MTLIQLTLVKEMHSKDKVRDTVIQTRYSNNTVVVVKVQDTRLDCSEQTATFHGKTY